MLAAESCDTVKTWPETENSEGLHLLQKKGKKQTKVFSHEALSDAPSCIDLFRRAPAMLETSAHKPYLPMGSDKKAKEEAFNTIYKEDSWEGGSGPGSRVESTKAVRQILASVLGHIAEQKMADGEKGDITMLDAPCGDMAWMPLAWKESEPLRMGTALSYHGADVSTVVLEKDRVAFESGEMFKFGGIKDGDVKANFSQMDLATDKVGAYDLIFMKDVLGHLHEQDIHKVLKNIKASGSRYLLTTTDPEVENKEITPDMFYMGRPVNLRSAPYNMDGLMCVDLQDTDASVALMALFDLNEGA